jgi:hypothetical protein
MAQRFRYSNRIYSRNGRTVGLQYTQPTVIRRKSLFLKVKNILKYLFHFLVTYK